MPAKNDTSVDAAFKAVFKILLTTIGVLLFCQMMAQSYGSTGFLVLLILTIIMCIRLRLRDWPARIAAGLLIFLLLPALATFVRQQVVKNTSPTTLVLVLASVSTGAYFIWEHRQGRKPETTKTSGAERTPIFPPEGQ